MEESKPKIENDNETKTEQKGNDNLKSDSKNKESTPTTPKDNQKTSKEYEMMKEATKERMELLEKEEALQTRKEDLHVQEINSGQAVAGQETKPETEDEKWAREAKLRYEGSGMDPTPDDSETTYG